MPSRNACNSKQYLVAILILAGAINSAACTQAQEDATGFPKKRASEKYSWQRQHAKVDAKGNLSWNPKPFKFEKGNSVRYIDYAKGNDHNSGKEKNSPWKHHPWDPKATGSAKSCSGIHTYIFKRGVTYRGALIADDSGKPGDPIRLTSDPSWGDGEAVISGSEKVTGWTKGADHKNIPDAAKVWYVDLDWAPRNLWAIEGGKITRINLARTPNWKVSDPEDVLSEWWTWEQPKWWEHRKPGYPGKTKVGGRQMHVGIDTKHLTKSEDYYKGAIVWSEWAIVMGTPFPSEVRAYDPVKKGIAFEGRWYGTSVQLVTANRYCLEDKPHYLDEAGEFWFEKKDDGGRLYARLPGDKNPNQVQVEAARYYNLIQDKCSRAAPPRMDIFRGDKNSLETSGLKHAVISGLSFRFTNTYWILHFAPWRHKEVDNAAIRLLGSTDDITVSNCVFEHVKCAIRVGQQTDRCTTGKHLFSDNRIEYIDGTSIKYNDKVGGMDVRVLRNKIFMSGLRPYRQSDGHCLKVGFPDTMEIAGNILNRIYGSGIFLHGGKGGNDLRDRPFCRNLVYGNQVVDSLLRANDWGGIETWQGGPFYVYNNVSGNPNGLWNWSAVKGKPNGARLGFAYYLDGGFKNYHFNNIAWGLSNELTSKHCSNTAFYHAIPTIQNVFSNNTAYLFAQGSGWSPAGGRQLNLGNIFSDISLKVFGHGKQKEDAKAVYKKYPLETIGYARNIFYNIPEKFGILEGAGAGEVDFDGFKKMAAEKKLLAGDLGILAKSSPLRDPAKHDFRLKTGSAAVDNGVKVFVPWALYAMVGEWNFCRNNSDPTILLDDHWYMRNYYVNRNMYRNCPTFNLKGTGVSAESYVQGALEDWTAGALAFDGKSTYCSITDAELSKEFSYKYKEKRKDKTGTVSGDAIGNPNPGTGNLLIEIYFKAAEGHTGGTLVSKESGTGYVLGISPDGSVSMNLKANGADSCSRLSSVKVNDGKWHHVIAELDRQAAQGITIYIDGRKANGAWSGSLPAQGNSLSNKGDLLVGKGSRDKYFHGVIDFLRIAKGTLKDAKTDISELYEWQFNGPFLRDFTGSPVTGKKRDAGAIELVD